MAEVAVVLDDKIEELLREAEQRLRAKQNSRSAHSLTVASQQELLKKETSETTTAKEASREALADQSTAEASELSMRKPQPRLSKKEFNETAKADAGPNWYNMPKTDLTPELQRDLKLLKMRDVLDPHRHYKKDNTKSAVPAFSQVGRMVEGRTEWFSARMTKKERKRTLLEEVLETEDTTRRFKSKYGEIQAAKTSGKKGYYKKMMQKRYGKK